MTLNSGLINSVLMIIPTYNERENIRQLVSQLRALPGDVHVLIVDDIFDTGYTMTALVNHLHEHRPASLRSMVLLRKHGRKAVSMEPDHVGFEIPNEFVVGYGLDYHDAYRNLPYVAALEPHELGHQE